MHGQAAPRLAATAPPDELDSEQGDDLDPLQEVFEQWATWVRTRRFYKPPSMPPSILGKLTARSRPSSGGPNAWNSAELSALNEAIESEPLDALDRQVFELHYRHRVKPIKIFAEALGISRRHWYNLLRSFEQRVHAASIDVRRRNEQARRALGSCVE